MTKVVVINGSQRMEKSNTSFVLTPFIEGMKKAGASVEQYFTKKLKILPCTGCFKCWFETFGECFIQDGMQDLYLKLKEADILVFATPVYIPLPGSFQNFLNRLCPIVEPILEYRNGRTRAKLNDDVKISKFVSVVLGGWWEKENLDIATKVIEELAMTTSVEYSGAILRPHVGKLREDTDKNKEIIKVLEEVGFQLISNGKMDEKNLDFISQPLVNKDQYLEQQNRGYLEAKNKI
ncbi:MAG: flavodoxin family protein [Candidatus Heimdallarchaeota archaeon]